MRKLDSLCESAIATLELVSVIENSISIKSDTYGELR
jgi:hypothetical protein